MFEIDMRYQNGKIYKIVSNITGDVYYGSTIQSLKRRLIKHKVDYKKYLNGKYHYVTSFKIIENGDYDIHLVENYRCLNKKQLESIERVYIENYKCINKYIPTRTNKEYYQDNKQEINKYKTDWYFENKERISNYRSEKIKCPCGSVVSLRNKAQHYKSKKHINYCN
jgi:hypothetical protein